MNFNLLKKFVVPTILMSILLSINSFAASQKSCAFGFSSIVRTFDSKEVKQLRRSQVFNHSAEEQGRELARLEEIIKKYIQKSKRGKSVEDIEEEVTRQQLTFHMNMSSTNEVERRFAHIIQNSERNNVFGKDKLRKFEALKEIQEMLEDSINPEVFMDIVFTYAQAIIKLRSRLKNPVLINDNVFPVVYNKVAEQLKKNSSSILNTKSIIDSLKRNASTKKRFADIDEATLTRDLNNIFLFAQKMQSAKTGSEYYVERLMNFTPKLFSYKFEEFPVPKNAVEFSKSLAKEINRLEAMGTEIARKLYSQRNKYTGIREGLLSFIPNNLKAKGQAENLYELGHSSSKTIEQLDQLRRSLLAIKDLDTNEQADALVLFKQKFEIFLGKIEGRKEERFLKQVSSFENIDSLVQEFNSQYLTLKAAVLDYQFTPRFTLDGEEVFGFDVKKVSQFHMLSIADSFPASKVLVKRKVARDEYIAYVLGLFSPEILHRLTRMVIRIPRQLGAKFSGKNLATEAAITELEAFFTRLIDEKSILSSYPIIDQIVYGIGSFEDNYKLFLNTAASNSLGQEFVNIFARRSDVDAARMYDRIFAKLSQDVDNINYPEVVRVDVPVTKSATTDVDVSKVKRVEVAGSELAHPYKTAFQSMINGRNSLASNGTLAPWFENPPNSARFYAMITSGIVSVSLASSPFVGYLLVRGWLTPRQGFTSREISEEQQDVLDQAIAQAVIEEASLSGVDIGNIPEEVRSLIYSKKVAPLSPRSSIIGVEGFEQVMQQL